MLQETALPRQSRFCARQLPLDGIIEFMASTELEKTLDHLDLMNTVVSEYLKGDDPTTIAKTLKMSRVRVVGLLAEWRGLISNNEAIRSRAKEALASADQHYSRLIGKAYEVIDSADLRDNLSAKTNAIKLIADMEAKRIDMLQKSGMLENKELAEELAESERKQTVLENILKEVVSDCSHCKREVLSRLSSVSDPEEAVVVDYTLPVIKE